MGRMLCQHGVPNGDDPGNEQCEDCIEGNILVDDPVNHPNHYTANGIEVIDFIEAKGLENDYCLGNVIKYIARAPFKGNYLIDLKKALWYLNRRIEQIENKEDEITEEFDGAPDFIKDDRESLLLEYITLLSEELDETVPVAYAHGWRSSRHEEGERLRKLLGL